MVSVARAREVNARLRAAGVTVHEWPGWESRGNGQTSAYVGCLVHHTATDYGNAPPVLVNGRPDLSGPLCNYACNADGSVTVIAAHPANHAGASGGRSMGPLPVTSLFNKLVMGLEIVYPGSSPMRTAQYRTATIWARIVTDVLGSSNIERARAHAETSITGKWDPGDAPGRTINMAAFRTAARIVGTTPVENDMDQSEAIKDSGPGHVNHVWLNTNQLLNNNRFGLEAQSAKVDALTKSVSALNAKVQNIGEQISSAVGVAVADYFRNNPPAISVDNAAVAAAVVAEFKKEGN